MHVDSWRGEDRGGADNRVKKGRRMSENKKEG